MFLTVVAIALLTLEVALANKRGACSSQEDRDWTHHQYSVLELETTDVVTPNDLYFGTAPLQQGTLITTLCFLFFGFVCSPSPCYRRIRQPVVHP
jgi:hypothetical protein